MRLYALFVSAVVLMAPPAFAEELLHAVAGRPMAPLFELEDIDGQVHRLQDYRGRVVVLNFWATWCPPCRFEMPSMERARERLAKRKIDILAVNVGEDADTIFTFTSDYPVNFPLLLDRDSRVISSYPVVGLPTTFIIDPEGRMVFKVIGTRKWDDDQLEARLVSLFQQ